MERASANARQNLSLKAKNIQSILTLALIAVLAQPLARPAQSLPANNLSDLRLTAARGNLLRAAAFYLLTDIFISILGHKAVKIGAAGNIRRPRTFRTIR